MKKKTLTIALLAGSMLLGSALSAQDVPPPERPPLPDDLKVLIQQFREQRADLLESRRQLMEQLRNASEEDRARIIAAFREANRDRVRAERELRRQIHEDLRDVRRARRRAHAAGNDSGG